MCYGPGFRVLDADGLGPMPNSSHVWNTYSAPTVCWISKPTHVVATFSLYDPKDCVCELAAVCSPVLKSSMYRFGSMSFRKYLCAMVLGLGF